MATPLFTKVKQSNSEAQTKTKSDNKYYLNLGFTTKEGKFIRLSQSIIISADQLLTESKNINDDTTEWAKNQKYINRAINELTQIFENIQEGHSANLKDFPESILNKLTFQLSVRGAKPNSNEVVQATDEDLNDLV